MKMPPWGFPWHGLLISPNSGGLLRVGGVSGVELPVGDEPFPANLGNSLSNAYGSGGMDVHLVRVPGMPELDLTEDEIAAQAALGRHWQNFTLLHVQGETSFTHDMVVHGRNLGGWVCTDPAGKRWLIKPVGNPSLLYGRATIGAPLSLDFEVLPFGYLGRAPADPVEITADLADIEQDGYGLVGDPYVRMRPWSIASHGREVLIALFPNRSPLSATDLPCGWLRLRLTGDGPEFGLELTVIYSRLETLGTPVEEDTSSLVKKAVAAVAEYTTSAVEGGTLLTGLINSAVLVDGPGGFGFNVGVQQRTSRIDGRVCSLAFNDADNVVEITAELLYQQTNTGSAPTTLSASGEVTSGYTDTAVVAYLSGSWEMSASYSCTFSWLTEVKIKRDGVLVDHARYQDLRSHTGNYSFEGYVGEEFTVGSPPEQFGYLGGPSGFWCDVTTSFQVNGAVIYSDVDENGWNFSLTPAPVWGLGVDVEMPTGGPFRYTWRRLNNQILYGSYSTGPDFVNLHAAVASQALWRNPSTERTLFSQRGSYNPGTRELVYVVDDSLSSQPFLHI